MLKIGDEVNIPAAKLGGREYEVGDEVEIASVKTGGIVALGRVIALTSIGGVLWAVVRVFVGG